MDKKKTLILLLFLVPFFLFLGVKGAVYINSSSYRVYIYSPNVTLAESGKYAFGAGRLALVRYQQKVKAAKGAECKTYDSVDDVPQDWQLVDSCERWFNRIDANQTINDVGKVTGEAKELFEKAKQEYKEGNYTGAKKLANLAIKKQKEQAEGRTFILILIVVIVTVGVGGGIGGFFLFQRLRKERVVEGIKRVNREIERIGREVQRRLSQSDRGWRLYQRLESLIREARRLSQNYKRMGYKKSSSQLKMIEKELRRITRELRRSYNLQVSYRKYKGVSDFERFRIKAELKLINITRKLKSGLKDVIEFLEDFLGGL